MRIRGSLSVALLFIVLTPVTPRAAPGSGADLCQQGGSQNFVGVSGDLVTHTFADANDCAMYAGQGGRIFVRTPAVASCENGGYANLVGADRAPFANEARCVEYAGGGGDLQPSKPVLTVGLSDSGPGTGITLTGSGLRPGSPVTLTVTLTGYGLLTLPSGTVGDDGTFARRYSNSFSCAAFRGFVAWGTDASGAPATSGPPFSPC
jgi:hypothetical protein